LSVSEQTAKYVSIFFDAQPIGKNLEQSRKNTSRRSLVSTFKLKVSLSRISYLVKLQLSETYRGAARHCAR